MVRLLSICFVAMVLASCASEPGSGAATPSRNADPLDPVSAFPQARGGNSYMRP